MIGKIVVSTKRICFERTFFLQRQKFRKGDIFDK